LLLRISNLATAALPLRLKADGSSVMAHAPSRTSEPHHHRATTKTSHKPFKSRHLTKSALKNAAKGKISLLEDKGKRKTPSQQVMSKIERRNQAKQKR